MHVAVWIVALLLVRLDAQDHGAKTGPDKPPATRPASATGPSTASAPSATPRDAEVLKELIREVERQPVTPAKGARSAMPSSAPSDTRGPRAKDEPLGQDGGSVVERSGRLTRVGQAIEFRFTRDDGKGTATFQLQPNEFLEQIERDVDAGAAQAVLSGLVQRYKGRTFLLVTVYRRAGQRGNLSP